MKKNYCFAIAALALLLTSCRVADVDNDAKVGSRTAPTFTSSFENVGTRTYVDSGLRMFWTSDDRLSIFTSSYNEQYRFDGQTGATGGSFSRVNTGQFVSGNAISANYGVYPYNASTSLAADEKILVELPPIQAYAENTFGVGANTMVAVTNGTSDTFLPFKNVCGYLVVKLYGEGKVTKVIFEGNNGEKIAGAATVVASHNADPVVTMSENATTSITIDCGQGIELGKTAEAATEFWFVIPPTTFLKGFTAKVENNGVLQIEKTTTGAKTIQRNVANTMTAIDVPVVVSTVSKVSLNYDNMTFTDLESTQTLIATVLPSDADNNSVIWTSSNTSVATVDQDGKVTAVGYGTAMITATTVDGGLTADCTVRVMTLPEGPVDLGLSVKWASINVGASKPEEYGGHYAWGETSVKTNYYWTSYKWCYDSEYTLTKYCSNSSYGYNGFIDTKTVLDDEDDVAHVTLGDNWRMPTSAELTELINQCTWTWTRLNGVNGRLVTGPNGNSIFLPAAGVRSGSYLYNLGSEGHYRSSSLITDYPFYDFDVFFNSDYVFDYSYGRRFGLSVRPVYVPTVSVTGISIDSSDLTFNKLGATQTLTATVSPSDATNKNVTWTSSNTKIAIVTQEGVVTIVGYGTATITAITEDGSFKATCLVKVVALPDVALPEVVDLGLSVKWASFNVGASKPEDYGDYYAWGETETKSDYSWSTYKWCNGNWNTLTKYCSNRSYGYKGFTDTLTVLELENDVASVALGRSWRMPTYDEFAELKTQCTWIWTSVNGVNGRLVTGPNGNSIFLPAAGYCYDSSFSGADSYGNYWSSSLYTDLPGGARSVGFGDGIVSWDADDRCYGRSVRPVYEE